MVDAYLLKAKETLTLEKGERKMERSELSEKQVREDNPHFSGDIRTIEEGPFNSQIGDYNYYKVVSDGRWKADYLWSPSQEKWILGAN